MGRNKITDDDGDDDGYRPFEPVIDLQYVGELKEKDEDLRPLTIRVQPEELKGTVEVKSTKDGLRFWSKASKGRENRLQSVADEGETFKVSQLPTTLYVEGVKVGSGNEFSVTSNLKASNGSAQRKKRMEAHVISMELIDQEQRLIYEYNSSIKFKLSGQPFDLETDDNYEVYDYRWWDGEKFTGVRSSQIRVRYGDEEPDDDDVFVPLKPEAKNRRKMYNVGVKIRKRERTLLTLTRKIRVALDKYVGKPLKALDGETDNKELRMHLELRSLANPPRWLKGDNGETYATELPNQKDVWGSQQYYEDQFKLLDPGKYEKVETINGGERIQYSPNLWPQAYGQVPLNNASMGDDRRVHLVLLGSALYMWDLKVENVRAVIEHEFQHLRQHREVIEKKASESIWRMLDDHAGDTGQTASFYSDCREADAALTELRNTKVGWRHYVEGGNVATLPRFAGYYNEAKEMVSKMDRNEERDVNRARAFLQMLYLQVGERFEGLTRPEAGGSPSYGESIRPFEAE